MKRNLSMNHNFCAQNDQILPQNLRRGKSQYVQKPRNENIECNIEDICDCEKNLMVPGICEKMKPKITVTIN